MDSMNLFASQFEHESAELLDDFIEIDDICHGRKARVICSGASRANIEVRHTFAPALALTFHLQDRAFFSYHGSWFWPDCSSDIRFILESYIM